MTQSLSASSDSCGQLSLPVISSLTKIIEVLNKENQELKGAAAEQEEMLEQLEISVTQQYEANKLLVTQLQETEEKLLVAEETVLIAEKRMEQWLYHEKVWDGMGNRILDLEDQVAARDEQLAMLWAERGSSEPASDHDDVIEEDEECPGEIEGENEVCPDGMEEAEESSGWDSREPTDVFVAEDNSDEFF